MDTFLATAGLVAVAAFTPGPNNLIVLRAAARAGVRGALPAIGGVIAGSVALVTVVALGGGALFALAPWLRVVVAVAGCLYLAAGALPLLVGAAPATARDAAPAGLAALVGFQFLNPKAWVMAWTATSAMPGALARLLPLFVVVPAAGLAAWATLGALLAQRLARPAARRRFDRATGALLLASAALLLAEVPP